MVSFEPLLQQALEDAGLSLSDVDGYFCAGDAPGPLRDPWTALGLAEEGTFHGFTGTSTGARIDWVLHTPDWAAMDAGQPKRENRRPGVPGLRQSRAATGGRNFGRNHSVSSFQGALLIPTIVCSRLPQKR